MMKTIAFTLSLLMVLSISMFAQNQNSAPLPAMPANGGIADIVVSPQVVTTVQIGQTQVLRFRAMLSDGTSTENFTKLPLPVTFEAHDQNGSKLTEDVMRCKLEVGECSVRSEKPRIVYVSAYLNGVFGLVSVTVNFASFRGMFPARMDVSASQAQAQEGVYSSVIATSPVTIDGPVTIRAYTRFTNSYADAERFVYLPSGVKYGQRIDINTENTRPLSFRGRKHFVVEMSTPSNGQVAVGYGSSVTTTEIKHIDAVVDDSQEMTFTVGAAYDPSVDYTVVLLRGDQFRIELAQNRSELFAYAQGGLTKLVFNKGSLGENSFQLPAGFYTVIVHGFDRSQGIGWSHSRADALGLVTNYILH